MVMKLQAKQNWQAYHKKLLRKNFKGEVRAVCVTVSVRISIPMSHSYESELRQHSLSSNNPNYCLKMRSLSLPHWPLFNCDSQLLTKHNFWVNELCFKLMMLGHWHCDVIFGRELPHACAASSSPLLLASIVHSKTVQQ